ncbi:MAG TPA: hypothetical protein GXZ90_09420 [Clostridiales bacterium]|nr:hypothetical protein [Clostridiales bacterium]
MSEKINQTLKQIKEYWDKYTSKQKTIIISVLSIVFLSIITLSVVLSRTRFEVLIKSDSPKDANTVVDLLEKESIDYKVGIDSVTISVDRKKYSDAALLIASHDVPSNGLSLDTLLNNSLSTTNSDRTLKLNLYIQDKVRNYLKTMKGVEDAQIYYMPEESSNTLISAVKDTSASVLLTVNNDFEIKTAETIAEVVSSIIGNTKTDKIKVADQFGNLLFGGEQDLYTGSASSNEDYRQRLRNTFINNIYMGLIKSGFDDAEIMPNLVFNMDRMSELYKEYIPAEGEEQGVQGKYYSYNSENSGYVGGTPGTASNDETDYMIEDTSNSTGNVNIQQIDYLPNERVTNIEYEIGVVIPDESSISIILRKIVEHKEEELELEGLLEGTTFQEYALANNESKKIDVDPEIIEMVSLATGISDKNIHVMAFENPLFMPRMDSTWQDSLRSNWQKYLQVFMAIIILAMLAFVIFRGLTPVEVTELEPELSVEKLLATTQEVSLDEIAISESSGSRKAIEKFVDEKPESVAQLLRNWLNQEWD